MKRVLLSAAVALVFMAIGANAHAQNLTRFAANFLRFDGGEVAADSGETTDNPVLFYDKTVQVPRNFNVLYVTVFGTTDTHNGARELINCQVDGVDCNNTGVESSNDSPPGWVTIANAAGDLHDNAASYSWCAVLPKKAPDKPQTREVTLRLASNGDGDVFMEQINVRVDGSFVKDGSLACADGDILDDEGEK